MSNRLAQEKSPYLLQHADNPVDWYPWGDEALERARRANRPILVSIGYSSCHWCHVMEHESFEDEAVARLMNENFVNIKVDREERPDVDAIYMEAVQALTGQGGWPLNVFLLPDGRPFYGGTYFPPEPRHGMPSWRDTLRGVSSAYRDQHAEVLNNANVLTEYLSRAQSLGQSSERVTVELLVDCYRAVMTQLDWRDGGFGAAPKFPQPLALEFVLRMHTRLEDPAARSFVEHTLHKMADGGIFDQLGGGFHRYSVDARWTVPHFEKMLYDNALLARVYVHAYQLTKDDFYRHIAEQTLDYLLRDMQSPEGGFYASEDADSEGEEGSYYVWTVDEIERLLDPATARIVESRYGVRAEGNFEGRTILTIQRSIDDIGRVEHLGTEDVVAALERGREALLAARAARERPATDTKILTSWNALAIQALAEAGRVLERRDYLQAARQAVAFALSSLRPGGRLVRSYRDGPGSVPAFLEDYAFLVESLLTLHETVFDAAYLDGAVDLANEMIERFWDDDRGAFYDTPKEGEGELIIRPRSFFDNPIPSGNSAATSGLLRLAAFTGDARYEEFGLAAFGAVRDVLSRSPLGFAHLLSALDFYLSPQTQVAIAAVADTSSLQSMIGIVFDRYRPNVVVSVGKPGSTPLLRDRPTIDGRPTAYVCERFACELPVTEPADLASQLDLTSQHPSP